MLLLLLVVFYYRPVDMMTMMLVILRIQLAAKCCLRSNRHLLRSCPVDFGRCLLS